ncbi:MAG: carboxypeptidase-like regulatory domain-containing protein [Bacteroidetes bacterium]|nr:carboxypeptidase-like regulatory domain-containing protein [Bacteroidota bacterium]
MKKIFTWLILICLISTGTVFAQSRTITGKVTSKEDGMTIPGVSVFVKGTLIGTVTDINGVYSIDVPASGKILTFSSLGMKSKEVPVPTGSTFDLVMESDVLKLDEVVVTANAMRPMRPAIT